MQLIYVLKLDNLLINSFLHNFVFHDKLLDVSSRSVVSLLLLGLMRCWQYGARLQLQWKALLLEKFFAALLADVLLADQHSVLLLWQLCVSWEFLLEFK